MKGSRTVAMAQVFVIILVAAFFAGCVDSGGGGGILGNKAPDAKFTLGKDTVKTNETVTLDATGSSDPDGSIEKYEWDIDGDGVTDLEGDIVDAKWMDDGEYNIKLTVTDNKGETSTATKTITVLNRAPSIEGYASTYKVKTNVPVEFTIEGSDPDGSIVEYRWDFDGDGQWDWTSSSSGTTKYSFPRPGDFNVTAGAVDDDGDLAVNIVFMMIDNRPPSVTATTNTSSAYTLTPIEFSAHATDPDGDVVSYEWDFDGDGTYDTTTNTSTVEHQYDTKGIYHPQVRVTDDYGDVNISEIDVIVINNRLPSVSLSASVSSVMTMESITFHLTASDADGTITSVKWDFDGDGLWDRSSTTVEDQSYTYTDDGYYTVKVAVEDNDGGETTAMVPIEVQNQPPTVSITMDTTQYLTNEAITYSWEASDPDGTISYVEWDFDGDGDADWYKSNPGSTSSTTYTFYDDGVFTATVTVKDNDNTISTDSITITVQNRAPEITLVLGADSVTTGREISLDANGQDEDGTIEQYKWDFDGDGTYDYTSTTPHITHSWSTLGTYTVKVTAVDDDGAEGSATSVLTVVENNPPVAVAGDDFTGYVGSAVNFNPAGSYDPDGDPLTYEWDYEGDGTYDWSSSSPTITVHTYNTAGTYNAVLRVSDGSASSTDTRVITIKVNHAPVANAGADVSGDTSTVFTFDGSASYDPDGDSLTYSWSFGDGTTGSGVTVQHTFHYGGTFTVTLTVTDPGGMQDSDTLTATIDGPQKFAIIVGISDYPGTGSDLQYADDDAIEWADYLHNLGYVLIGPKDNSGQPTDAPFLNSQATKQNILDAIDYLKNIEGPDTYVVFAYSGHGENYNDVGYSGTGSIIVDYTEYGLFDTDLGTAFGGYESQHITFFFDCCRSGDYDDDVGGPGRMVLEACDVNEYSLDDPYHYHGAFTYWFLVDGLENNPSWDVETAWQNAYNHCSSSSEYGYNAFHPEISDPDPNNSWYL